MRMFLRRRSAGVLWITPPAQRISLAVLEQLPLRAAFVTAGLIVGTGTLTGKHDRHLSHKT